MQKSPAPSQKLPTPAGPATVHQLDTRPAELGAGLRRLFAPVVDEPVPPEIARLAAELEARVSSGTVGKQLVERPGAPQTKPDPA